MSHSSLSSQDCLILADIVGAYGIKGWVRLRVRLDDPNLLLTLPNLQLASSSKAPSTSTQSVTVQALKRQGKGFIACLDGVTDRTAAEALRGLEIQVATAAFPAAPDDEVYWRDLEGLEVWCTEEGSRSLLGKVKTLLETGANDVLVIAPCEGSIDDQEHLVPWIPDEVVTRIDLSDGRIEVDWYANV
ncbi:MAG: 16S rRNA processing protein RimM [Halieaceae bacterium]|nr:MAG: 16S rRNA processing protein RimM [Halieaceae bacterium]